MDGEYGCVQVIENRSKARRYVPLPKWKQLVAGLERGGRKVVVMAKFSNALQGSFELSAFIGLCRIKVVRIISIHDRIDSRGKLFSRKRRLPMCWRCSGRFPKEVAILRYSSFTCLEPTTEREDSEENDEGYGQGRQGKYYC